MSQPNFTDGAGRPLVLDGAGGAALPPHLVAVEPLAAADLEAYEEFLLAEEAELSEEQVAQLERVRRFEVHDDDAAEWAMRYLRRYSLRAAEVKAQAAEWRAPIDEWERAELAKLAPSLAFFAGHLEAYGLEVRKANPDRATVALPSGDVATTKSSPKADVVDDEAVALWLAESLEEVPTTLCKWTPKVYVGPLRKLVVLAEEEVEIGTDEESGDPVTELRRYAVSPVDPSTGEPWADEVPLADRAVPGVAVSEPTITVKVSPRK